MLFGDGRPQLLSPPLFVESHAPKLRYVYVRDFLRKPVEKDEDGLLERYADDDGALYAQKVGGGQQFRDRSDEERKKIKSLETTESRE